MGRPLGGPAGAWVRNGRLAGQRTDRRAGEMSEWAGNNIFVIWRWCPERIYSFYYEEKLKYCAPDNFVGEGGEGLGIWSVPVWGILFDYIRNQLSRKINKLSKSISSIKLYGFALHSSSKTCIAFVFVDVPELFALVRRHPLPSSAATIRGSHPRCVAKVVLLLLSLSRCLPIYPDFDKSISSDVPSNTGPPANFWIWMPRKFLNMGPGRESQH